MRTYFKPLDDKGPLSGGIRVGDIGDPINCVTGEYITLVPGRLIWGLHNHPQYMHKVGAGYRFNNGSSVGEWHDFIPDYQAPGRRYLQRIGECQRPSTQSQKNRKDGVFELKIWDRDEKIGYAELCAPPIVKLER